MLFPADTHAEQVCIAAALLGMAPKELEAWHFFEHRHRMIFEAIGPDLPTTFTTLTTRNQHHQVGGSPYLAELTFLLEEVVSVLGRDAIQESASVVIAWARRRRLAHAAERLVVQLRSGKLEPEDAWATLKSECAA